MSTPQLLAPERLPVDHASAVGPTRAAVGALARSVGLPARVVDDVELVATELAENLHRHAFGGDLLVLPPAAGGAAADQLVLLAVDRGPGVEGFDRCLVDGYTTGGTLGTGLGAVRRLADRFDAVSEPGRGTVVLAGFDVADGHVDPGEAVAGGFASGWVGFPLSPDEPVNGDGWTAVRRGSRLVVLVADGLGHGPLAARASTAATETLRAHPDLPPADLLALTHTALRHTRGAAVTVAALELDAARSGGEVVTAGLGNVAVLVVGPDGSSRRIATSHGTAGTGRVGSTPSAVAPFPAGGLLVLHTDGLTSRWDLAGRVDLVRRDPAVVAAALWRDHARGTDDSMVVVVRARRTTR